MRRKDPAIERMQSIPLFSACTRQELELILSRTTELRFKPGDVLTREGERGHEFLVIVEGQADVLIGGQKVATLGPGEFFGELALLDDGPRTATVVAATDLVAEVSGQREFDDLVTGAPHLAKKLLVGLARRLREADLHLAPHESATQ